MNTVTGNIAITNCLLSIALSMQHGAVDTYAVPYVLARVPLARVPPHWPGSHPTGPGPGPGRNTYIYTCIMYICISIYIYIYSLLAIPDWLFPIGYWPVLD